MRATSDPAVLGSAGDEELARLARGGPRRRAAFAALVERHHQAVANYAARRLGDPDLAEDVVQETFCRAFRQVQRFHGGSFRAWLLTIARFLCMAERKRARLRRRSRPIASLPEVAAAPPARDPARQEELARVQGLFESLDPPAQEILELRIFQDMTLEEISRLTASPLSSVWRHYRDALRRLKRNL
jgi:RNA polymerase sigma-70 factor (ECF subfamily)